MKKRYVVLAAIVLFVLSIGWQAWLESTIEPGHMFVARNELTTNDITGGDLNRPCRIAPGSMIFILEQIGPGRVYLAVHFTQADTKGTDLCRHQAAFITDKKEIEATCGGIIDRVSGVAFGR